MSHEHGAGGGGSEAGSGAKDSVRKFIAFLALIPQSFFMFVTEYTKNKAMEDMANA